MCKKRSHSMACVTVIRSFAFGIPADLTKPSQQPRQVNEHYVKPLTQAAGGMSYALMKHPEGLLCQARRMWAGSDYSACFLLLCLIIVSIWQN